MQAKWCFLLAYPLQIHLVMSQRGHMRDPVLQRLKLHLHQRYDFLKVPRRDLHAFHENLLRGTHEERRVHDDRQVDARLKYQAVARHRELLTQRLQAGFETGEDLVEQDDALLEVHRRLGRAHVEAVDEPVRLGQEEDFCAAGD